MYNNAVLKSYNEAIFTLPNVKSLEIISLIESKEIMDKIISSLSQFNQISKLNLNLTFPNWPFLREYLVNQKSLRMV